MKLLIVEEDDAFRDFLRLRVAEQAGEDLSDVFEATTLGDALSILREETIDAAICDEVFPRGWSEDMGNPSEWRANSVTLHEECLARNVAFMLLCSDDLRKLAVAIRAIYHLLARDSTHRMLNAT